MPDFLHPPTPSLTDEALRVYRTRLVDAVAEQHDRAQPRRVWRWRSPRAIALVAAVCALAISGAALALGTDLFNWDVREHAMFDPAQLTPAPASSFSTITQGSDWALIGWKSQRGICNDYVFVDNRNADGYNFFSSCSSNVIGSAPDRLYTQPAPSDHIGVTVGQGAETTDWILAGRVASDVARVELKTPTGAAIPVKLLSAPANLDTPLRFFVYRDATGGIDAQSHQHRLSIKEAVAYDEDGAVLQTVPIG